MCLLLLLLLLFLVFFWGVHKWQSQGPMLVWVRPCAAGFRTVSTGLTGGEKFSGGTLAPNGKVYLVRPRACCARVLFFLPKNKERKKERNKNKICKQGKASLCALRSQPPASSSRRGGVGRMSANASHAETNALFVSFQPLCLETVYKAYTYQSSERLEEKLARQRRASAQKNKSKKKPSLLPYLRAPKGQGSIGVIDPATDTVSLVAASGTSASSR